MKRSLPCIAPLAVLACGLLALLPYPGAAARPGVTSRVALLPRDAPARADAPAIFLRRPPAQRRPAITLFTAIPATLPASGGSVRLEALTENATRCRFTGSGKLASLPRAVRCSSGRAFVTVHLGANRSATEQTYRFAVMASGPRGERTSPQVDVHESSRTSSQPTSASSPEATATATATAPASSSTSATLVTAAPLITSEPLSWSVVDGSPVSFSAAASGTPTPTVQWQVLSVGSTTWQQIPGATSPSYTFTPTAGDSGNEYEAVFVNSAGTATTIAATLTVTASAEAPQITIEPSTETVITGSQASFSAGASGSPTPTVQWQLSTDGGSTWQPISGATSTTYTFTPTTGDGGSQYEAVFTNSAGTATSAPATLTVEAPPQVTSEPSSETVTAGDQASFTAVVSGSPTPTVEWLISSNGGASWSLIAFATSPHYSFTATQADNGNEYEAVFTNAAGTATTPAVTLTVQTPPQIVTQPSDESVPAADNATFSATASGTPAPSVQWQVSTDDGDSWGNVAGATSPSYSFTTSEQENGYEFRAVFTNPASSATTSAVTLTLTDQKFTNWSGYAAVGDSFTAVSGSWTVPTVSCGSETTYSAQWIGIDGFSSDTVEQDGTEADCSGGAATYDAWYELYGDYAADGGNEIELNYPVQQGDAMSSTVSFSSGVWTFVLADASKGWTATTHVSWSGAQLSSAEWVGERPELCSDCSPTDLSDFGSLSFTSATATANGSTGPINAYTYAPMQMVDNSGDILASPGSLDSTGEDFTDTWYGSS